MDVMDPGRYSCALCDGSDYRPVCEKGRARYVQCAHCNVVRQHPYPTSDEISDYYERYQSLKTSQSAYLSDAGFEAFKRDKLLTFADLKLGDDAFIGKRILDVGCATGQFLELMQDRGASSVMGIDASKQCIEIAKARGLPCEMTDFLSFDKGVDVITMWHLIEHLPRPQDFVRHAFSLLPEGGWLLIETPAIGMISEAFGSHWRYFMPTEHINLFPIDALSNLCISTGFSLRNFVRFGSGNDSEEVPVKNKRAMDKLAKQNGFGDTMALWFIKGR